MTTCPNCHSGSRWKYCPECHRYWCAACLAKEGWTTLTRCPYCGGRKVQNKTPGR